MVFTMPHHNYQKEISRNLKLKNKTITSTRDQPESIMTGSFMQKWQEVPGRLLHDTGVQDPVQDHWLDSSSASSLASGSS